MRAAGGRTGTLRATFAVARKELRESFRDRHTVAYSVLLPVLLYPALFWCMIQAALVLQGRREHTEARVALAAAAVELVPEGLAAALERPPAPGGREAAAPDAPGGDAADGAAPVLSPVAVAPAGPFPDAGAARAWLEELPPEERPDALLWLGDPAAAAPDADGERAPPSRLFHDSTESGSVLALRRVEERVDAFAEARRAAAARAAGHEPAELEPYAFERHDTAAGEELGAYFLSFVLPILLVVMTTMGAFFTAVDLTAGERERGTSETTLLLPVPRLAVHQGKILAVCATALLATVLNLLALGLSAGHLLTMLASGIDLEIELPLFAFLTVAPLAVLFAFATSAVLTGAASLARTFKEGQALLGPVQLVLVMPAMVGLLPGLELDWRTALVPVVNVVLAFRTMLRGELLPLEFSLTAASLLAFTVGAIALALRVLSREATQLSDRPLSLRRLGQLLRSSAPGE